MSNKLFDATGKLSANLIPDEYHVLDGIHGKMVIPVEETMYKESIKIIGVLNEGDDITTGEELLPFNDYFYSPTHGTLSLETQGEIVSYLVILDVKFKACYLTYQTAGGLDTRDSILWKEIAVKQQHNLVDVTVPTSLSGIKGQTSAAIPTYHDNLTGNRTLLSEVADGLNSIASTLSEKEPLPGTNPEDAIDLLNQQMATLQNIVNNLPTIEPAPELTLDFEPLPSNAILTSTASDMVYLSAGDVLTYSEGYDLNNVKSIHQQTGRSSSTYDDLTFYIMNDDTLCFSQVDEHIVKTADNEDYFKNVKKIIHIGEQAVIIHHDGTVSPIINPYANGWIDKIADYKNIYDIAATPHGCHVWFNDGTFETIDDSFADFAWELPDGSMSPNYVPSKKPVKWTVYNNEQIVVLLEDGTIDTFTDDQANLPSYADEVDTFKQHGDIIDIEARHNVMVVLYENGDAGVLHNYGSVTGEDGINIDADEMEEGTRFFSDVKAIRAGGSNIILIKNDGSLEEYNYYNYSLYSDLPDNMDGLDDIQVTRSHILSKRRAIRNDLTDVEKSLVRLQQEVTTLYADVNKTSLVIKGNDNGGISQHVAEGVFDANYDKVVFVIPHNFSDVTSVSITSQTALELRDPFGHVAQLAESESLAVTFDYEEVKGKIFCYMTLPASFKNNNEDHATGRTPVSVYLIDTEDSIEIEGI